MFLRYNELRAHRRRRRDRRAGDRAERRREREAAAQVQPRDWVGTVTPSQLAFPYLVNWGFPERFQRAAAEDER